MLKTALRILMLVLLVIVGAIESMAVARADGMQIAVCMTLDDYPTISGVTGVLKGLIEEGYSPEDAGFVIGRAVRDVCPEHMDLVMRYANALDAPVKIT